MFYCPVCGKEYTQITNLKAHFNKIHTVFQNDYCPVCGLETKRNGIFLHYVAEAKRGDPCHIILYYLVARYHTQKHIKKTAINLLSDPKYYKCLNKFFRKQKSDKKWVLKEMTTL